MDKETLKKLMEFGWKSEDGENFKKGKDKIRIFFAEIKSPSFLFNQCPFDFIILNINKSLFVIPKELIDNVDNPNLTYPKLNNKFELLGTKNQEMLGLLMDYGIKGSEIGRTGIFFPLLQEVSATYNQDGGLR